MGGILGLVFLVLLVLKLAGIGMVATWPWWVVFAPAIAWVVLVTIVAICTIKSNGRW